MLPVALSGAGGLSAALAFEPAGVGWLALPAVVLLWLGIRRQVWQRTLLHGASFALVFIGSALWWLVSAIGWPAWAFLTLTQAFAITLAAVGMRAVARLPMAPVWVGAVWTAVESLRSGWPLGGMPWARLGVTVVDTPWEGLLPYVGIAGTGFLIVAGGVAVTEALARPAASTTTPAVIIGLLGLGSMVAPVSLPVSGALRVAVVQGGVPGDGRDVAAHHREVTLRHAEATVALASGTDEGGLDLVVWPENASAVDPVRDPRTRMLIDRAARAVGAPVLMGGIFDGADDRTAYNRGLVWLPDGRTGPSYTKSHPVPFGEYIPWRTVVGGWSARFDRIPRDFLPGRGEGPLPVAGTLVADAICFDVAYDDVLPRQVRDGARLVTVQTSNATFYGTAQPEQQFEITRARALELGRTVAVASTNGVSAIIGPRGEVVVRAPIGGTATLVEDVPLVSELTPAVRLAGWWSRLIVSLALVGLLGAAIRREPPDQEDAAQGYERHLAENPPE